MVRCVHAINVDGYIPTMVCLDRPFTPEEIPTITEVPPEDSETKEIKLTVPIKSKRWCWLCKSHGPEKVCPRKDEIGTKYGRQRLKELLQEMVKAEEKSKLDQEKNGRIPELGQRVSVLEAPPLEITKKEFVESKVVQPPEGKIPSVKPIELGDGAQWPYKPTTSTLSKHMGGSGGQSLGKSTQGTFNARGRGNKNGQEEETTPHLDPLPEEMVEMEVMVMVVMMEMMMGMMMMMMRMTMMMKPKQLLRVKMEKTQMHLLVKVHQEEMMVEVMDHHLIRGLEIWDLKVEGEIEVKEDKEGAWVYKVYQVYKDHKDLRALRD